MSKSTQGCKVIVSDSMVCEECGEGIDVILWGMSRPWNRPHIHDMGNLILLEQGEEFLKRMC